MTAGVQSPTAVLILFPFAGWLAAVTSLVMLVILAAAGELRVRSGAVSIVLFLLAAYGQFFSGSAGVAAAGLGLQTLLAVGLIIRWRLAT
jgi:hypothetical protein